MKRKLLIVLVILSAWVCLCGMSLSTEGRFSRRYKLHDYKFDSRYDQGTDSTVPDGGKIKLKNVESIYAEFHYSWAFDELELDNLTVYDKNGRSGKLKSYEASEVGWLWKCESRGLAYIYEIYIFSWGGDYYVFHVDDYLDFNN